MKNFAALLSLGIMGFSASALANDCRAIFDPGYSPEAQAMVGKNYKLVDEEKTPDVRVIPFRIIVKDDVDVDPETLTFRLMFFGETVLEEKHDAGDFQENVDRATAWIKNLPSCDKIYRQRTKKN
jgi:hypothetical protein